MDTINLEASPRLRWRSDCFFLVTALLGGVALATAEFVDPTVFSPLTPPEGIHNWLGLPGALIGGSLLEIFGPPAPLLFWFLIPLSRPHWHRFSLLSGWYHALLLCWLLSILHVLVLTLEHNTVPFQGLELRLSRVIGFAVDLAASASPRGCRSNWCGLLLSECTYLHCSAFPANPSRSCIADCCRFWTSAWVALASNSQRIVQSLGTVEAQPANHGADAGNGPGEEATNVNGAGSRRRLLID